ncbi:ankyrin repeat-containing domain protein [Trichoderma ceciliae]
MSNPTSYTVGWICAIAAEYVAAQVFLDEEHEGPDSVSPNDTNDYTLGRIGKHNVVIAVLPDGEYGTASAASAATNMLNSFPNVKIGLMVGIGGGVPSERHDIRLGDVVVGAPRNGNSGVFQYDFGKTIQSQGFQHTRFLNQPPTTLRTALMGIQSQYTRKGHQLGEAINDVLAKNRRLREYERPQPNTDRLLKAEVTHDVRGCTFCANDPSNLVLRSDRTKDEDNPKIHHGLIASANQSMKDALIRDRLAAEKDVLCFEMEAGGLMNHFPCLIIRGICDYSDTHKNKEWQGYAAMVAAAYTKDLLSRIAPSRLEVEKPILDILSSVQNTIQDTNTKVDKLDRRRDDQEHQSIADWLTMVDYAPQQSDFIARREEGTGEWLIKSDEFQQWLKQSNQTLFCPGMPGAGKTIITSFVIHYLYDLFRHDSTIGIAYLYCNFRQQHEQKSTDLILSLLKQLVQGQPVVPQSVRNLYIVHKLGRTRPSLNEILTALYSVATTYSRIFLVVDALDECSIEGRRKFLSEVFNLQAKTGVNFFATSRFIQEIEKEFKRSLSLEIRACDADVQKYLDSKLQNFRSLVTKSITLQEEIKTRITKAVDGMFLLAQLYIDSLVYKTTRKEIRLALEELELKFIHPNDDKRSRALDRAYTQAMERINCQATELRELAKLVLSWITCAKRALTSTELQHAIAVEEGDLELDLENITEIEDMIFVCAGLVVIDEESDIIRLVHYTTQEYFDRTWESWFPNVHADITIRCVTYLSFNNFKNGYCQTDVEFQRRIKSHIFYDYAARNWGYHARMSSSTEDMSRLILNFLESENKAAGSNQAIMASDDTYRHYGYRLDYIPGPTTALHLAAYFGLEESVSALLNKTKNINPRIQDGNTPLHWAAENGHESVVKLLLDKGADPNVQGYMEETPLHNAVEKGHEAVMRLLLENGADPNNRYDGGSTPLHRAAWKGHEAAVNLLLDKGANMNIEERSNSEGMAIHMAAFCGHETVVKLLLGRDTGPTREYQYSERLLNEAVLSGHEAVVTLLFNNGIELDHGYGYDEISLHRAAEIGNEAIVKLLLDKGADLDCQDGQHHTPLHRAAGRGHEAVVNLLLEKGADPNYEDLESRVLFGSFRGRTPLRMAIEKGHEAVAKLLLEKGADPDRKDWKGITPLDRAKEIGHETLVRLLLDESVDRLAENSAGLVLSPQRAKSGHEKRVKQLLEEGVDLDLKDNKGATQLHMSTYIGHDIATNLLLEQGASLNAQDDKGATPLHVAIMKGHQAVVELLLKKNANIYLEDKRGQKPLYLAIAKGDEAITKLLLEKGANLNFKDDKDQQLLSLAVVKGHEGIVKLLLENGTDPDLKYNKNATPLYVAIGRREKRIAQLLLDNGANPNFQGNQGITPLHIATSIWEKEMIELLLQKGADPDIKDNKGIVPIHVAIEIDLEVVVKLLNNGANMNMKDNSGITPLHMAAWGNKYTIAKALIEKGANIDVQDNKGATPLHVAAVIGDEDMVKLLQEKGADPYGYEI